MKHKKLWTGLILVVLISFGVLIFFGTQIYRKAPPVPKKVVNENGTVLFTGKDIKDGQNVWQSIGGHELGTIWGHGAYQAPDWTAERLHKEAMFMLNRMAGKKYGKKFKQLNESQQAALKVSLQKEIRKNTYNEETGVLTISNLRAKAYQEISRHYKKLFMGHQDLHHLREAYSMAENTIKDEERMEKMNSFFFWASWATVTERPGKDVTYTNNWPPEELVGNQPSRPLFIWTGFSVIVLLLGIGLLSWYYITQKKEETMEEIPSSNPLKSTKMTPSMKATLKYFYVVSALILVQIIMGVITAHYGVEGQGFYGIPLAEIMPYSISRTWHVQLAIFWIATAWLATGLFFAPAVSGKEPKGQKFGVNFLFIALLIIVLGSLAGQWMGVMQKLGLAENFWLGHMGYEYLDLGRFWQIFLFIGLILWLFLMTRALIPALKKRSENRQLLLMFVIASVAIALFYGAALMWGQQTNLAIAEYWRWWVVHLWVEGFFEVFATTVIALIFVRMKLINARLGTAAVLFATIIFLSGGIIGTFHHLYFTGTPTAVLALGATFSALEVVPLVLIGYEAYHNLKLSHTADWVKVYKWPIYTFIAVAFWNFLGPVSLASLLIPRLPFITCRD